MISDFTVLGSIDMTPVNPQIVPEPESVFEHFLSPLSVKKHNFTWPIAWPITEQNLKRKEFCNKYYWYMDICRS